MRKFSLGLTLTLISSRAFAADPTGDWLVADKTAVIRVQPCGAEYCGNIAWTIKPGLDEKNPDPAKRSRPMVGVQILMNMKAAGANRWDGRIYNAQDGKIYTGNIQLVSTNVLKIEGCVMGFLCSGENWARAKCDEAPPASKKGPPGGAAATPTSCRAVAP